MIDFSKFQLAFYAHNEAQADGIKKALMLENSEWIEDEVIGWVQLGESTVNSNSRAKLRFCYDYPVEIEILTYLEGPHWHEEKGDYLNGYPFLSHIGIHIDDLVFLDFNPPGILLQKMNTISHTNPYLAENGFKYQYEIYSSMFGIDLKYIKRIEPRTSKPIYRDKDKDVPTILREAANLFESRNPVYGSGYKRVGSFFTSLFPDGVTLKDESDFLRFRLFIEKGIKLMRYAGQFQNGGHLDSTMDDIVYSAMLAEADQKPKGTEPPF